MVSSLGFLEKLWAPAETVTALENLEVKYKGKTLKKEILKNEKNGQHTRLRCYVYFGGKTLSFWGICISYQVRLPFGSRK